ncbi:hypothetical protein BVV20_22740 [Xanthomonas oryzae pv. oryzae]|nr:hypothetical protein BVV20_22740 [Xanthomonas oryzae pv. oryzae]
MGENCQKPGRSVTKTGNSSTPITQMKPCNGCGLGVFQGRLIRLLDETDDNYLDMHRRSVDSRTLAASAHHRLRCVPKPCVPKRPGHSGTCRYTRRW